MSLHRSERHAALDESYPSCSGPCNQGRAPCNTPQACELHEPPLTRNDLALAAVIVSVVAMFVYLGPMVQQWIRGLS